MPLVAVGVLESDEASFWRVKLNGIFLLFYV